MSSTNNQYIKFMSDIIDSGLWGRLSSSAKTLYLVLLKFSDQNFKPVWPSTDTLLKLTGFKTKKSIVLGKKELIKEGLLQYKAGSGRTNSTYYFSFSYEGSKITPEWGTAIPRSGVSLSFSGSPVDPSHRDTATSPNNLNITINNTQTNKQLKDNGYDSMEKLMEIYDFNLVETALQVAKNKGLENNIPYIAGVCKNLANKSSKFELKNNHSMDTAQHIIDSWKSFLDWSSSHLTKSSMATLEQISVEVDGQTIFIRQELNEFLKQIIAKYFNEEIKPKILVVFAESLANLHKG